VLPNSAFGIVTVEQVCPKSELLRRFRARKDRGRTEIKEQGKRFEVVCSLGCFADVGGRTQSAVYNV
jgi:hypothetical protein